MDEIFARRDLLKPERLRWLSAKSDLAGLLQAGSHLGAILATGTALYLSLGTLWAIPFFLAHGILINFLYAGQHELSHWTVFRTKWLNEALGRLFGFLVFFPRDFDQIQHFAHHRHTQDWARDGELARPPYTFRSYLIWLLGPSYWWTRWTRIARLASGVVVEPYIADSRKADVIREARWHAGLYGAIAIASIASGSWAAVIYWLAPMLLAKSVHQMQNTIEHLGLAHLPDIFKNTRSTRTNPLMRWLCWNMQFHTAHHAFPGVPFNKLPQLDREIFAENGIEPYRMGYLAFQRAVLAALWRAGSEADYPDDAAWIVESGPQAQPISQAVRG
ncbi:MAG: fatty acid desaturase [Proteobacteria bacterium]|nr:fatty acid desaturase [Pseudomonadota bacterium]MBI3499740.1 fatty acid desaturase [Pseudomonadota bacterium]